MLDLSGVGSVSNETCDCPSSHLKIEQAGKSVGVILLKISIILVYSGWRRDAKYIDYDALFVCKIG